MLCVRYGPFQPSLERAFLEDLRELKSADPLAPVAVVVPSRRLSDRLQRLCAREAGLALLGARFHTFYSLALAIVEESGGLSRALLREPLFFDRLLDSLLEDRPGRPRRLAAAYRASLRDLIDAGVEPRAGELVREGLLPDPEESGRLDELLALLARYEERLERIGAAPVSELTRAAAEHAAESAYLGRFRRFLYYGFYDLTGLQCDFFEAVAREYPVTLYFPYRRGAAAFAFADRFFETKLHLGGRAPQELPAPAEGRALGDALDALFEPGRSAPVEPGRLRILNASGARDEAWRVAKEILRLREDEGIPYDEIGVAARTLEPYRAAIAEAFSESEVPFHASAEEPLLRRPAARLAWSLLSWARRDYPALALLDITGSPFYAGDAGPDWPTLIRRLRIDRGWRQWEGRLEPASRADFELQPQLAAEGRPGRAVPRAQVAALWSLARSWRARLADGDARPWSAWAAHAAAFVRETLARAEGDDGFAAFLAALDRLRALDLLGGQGAGEGGGRVRFDEFLDALEEQLGHCGLPLSPEPNRGVRVLDAMEARGDSFRVLFLLGLQEGLFPRAVREDPILRDAARAALRETGGYWIATKQAGYDEEKLLFRLLAGAASERLYCVYPRSDEEGRAQVPSTYLLELCRAARTGLHDPELAERVPRQPRPKLEHPPVAGRLSPKEALIAEALAGGDGRALCRALGRRGGFGELLPRARELNRAGEPGPLDGVVGPPEPYLAQLRRGGLSPTALEMLARCPFQFFASRVLGFGELEEPSDSGELAPALKGELYHRILADFYGELESDGFWERPDAPFPDPALARAQERSFAAHGWRELGLYPLVWEIAREGMRAHLRRFLAWDLGELRARGLRPALREAELAAELPVPLPEPLRGMAFRGRADRIDLGPEGFRVIDYKTRWRRGTLEKRVADGELFQAPLYLELAARLGALAGRAPQGVRFYALEDAEEAGQPVAQDYGAEAHAAGEAGRFARLAALLESIAAGRFPIRPDEGRHGHCRWCSFGDLCRKSHAATAARARA